ncbi:MAG: hypothetical protein OEZ22_14975 [Spirochaetia bacterium]|nr:hypothetical protein [Spirochaetia bacterium]
MSFNEQYELFILNGIFGIGGVIIGAIIPLLKDLISNKNANKLERIKIHDKDRIQAYQDAFDFTNVLKVEYWDKNKDMDIQFLNACSEKFFKIFKQIPYYSKNVRNNILEIEELNDKLFINIANKQDNNKLVGEEISEIYKKLRKNLKDDFKKWDQ